MNRFFQLTDYLLIAMTVVYLYGEMTNGANRLDISFLAGTMFCLFMAKRYRHPLWRFLAFFGTAFFMTALLGSPLYLRELSFLYFSNEYIVAYGIVFLLSILCMWLRARMYVLNILWFVFYTLAFYVTFTLPGDHSFFEQLTTLSVAQSVMTQYMSVFLFAVAIGVLLDMQSRNRTPITGPCVVSIQKGADLYRISSLHLLICKVFDHFFFRNFNEEIGGRHVMIKQSRLYLKEHSNLKTTFSTH
ncbi:hypothetical protein [Thalassobacillus sp. C254]|uniref:hypothetical protein n=1 Tax=Thalassobacillus sp. C254 TaxID=1225341 RepID=UPI0006CF2AD1|nr:hypothetical protein [Thalassobacillus sp. C254]